MHGYLFACGVCLSRDLQHPYLSFCDSTINMAPSAVSHGLEKLQETLDGSLEGRKLATMTKDIKNYHDPNNRITTDYGSCYTW